MYLYMLVLYTLAIGFSTYVLQRPTSYQENILVAAFTFIICYYFLPFNFVVGGFKI